MQLDMLNLAKAKRRWTEKNLLKKNRALERDWGLS